MAWKTINRNESPVESGQPVLSDALRDKIRAFFPRYETRRAAILPALHIVQNEHNHITWKAMQELAELLEIPAADIFDTVSFYSYLWTEPRGEKVVIVCRSISCEVLGADKVLTECKKVLGIGEHESTPDGKFSLMTEECLAACDHGPCLYVNERVHKRVSPADVRRILNDPDCDRLDIPRSELYDGVSGTGGTKSQASENSGG